MQLETELFVSQQQQPVSAQSSTRQGLLFVLSAPSGTGKDTVINTLKQQGMDFYVVPSVTTRVPRPNESDGNPYHFVSQETFERLVSQNELLEYANVHGNWYGQPRKPIRDNLSAGRDVLLKIDVKGAATIRSKVPEAIFIFLIPGSLDELAQRLTERQTETEEELQRRLADARKELAEQHWYDYLITNRQGHLQDAVDCLRAVMLAEHCRVHPRTVDV
ncbi:MAG TPA: guanylate kinase [Ktedonobacteraceae bacterium]|nr:guanylate kinase [Ktedonobacteraceae bacterium]